MSALWILYGILPYNFKHVFSPGGVFKLVHTLPYIKKHKLLSFLKVKKESYFMNDF